MKVLGTYQVRYDKHGDQKHNQARRASPNGVGCAHAGGVSGGVGWPDGALCQMSLSETSAEGRRVIVQCQYAVHELSNRSPIPSPSLGKLDSATQHGIFVSRGLARTALVVPMQGGVSGGVGWPDGALCQMSLSETSAEGRRVIVQCRFACSGLLTS